MKRNSDGVLLAVAQHADAVRIFKQGVRIEDVALFMVLLPEESECVMVSGICVCGLLLVPRGSSFGNGSSSKTRAAGRRRAR